MKQKQKIQKKRYRFLPTQLPQKLAFNYSSNLSTCRRLPKKKLRRKASPMNNFDTNLPPKVAVPVGKHEQDRADGLDFSHRSFHVYSSFPHGGFALITAVLATIAWILGVAAVNNW